MTSVSVSFPEKPSNTSPLSTQCSLLPSVPHGLVCVVRMGWGKLFISFSSLPFVYRFCCDTRKTELMQALQCQFLEHLFSDMLCKDSSIQTLTAQHPAIRGAESSCCSFILAWIGAEMRWALADLSPKTAHITIV